MTQAQTCAHGLVIPSSPQLWLGAMLRALVELVLYVASIFRMRPSRLPRECHTDVTPAALPGGRTDTQSENETAAPDSQTIEALMVSSTRCVRPSNHEGVLAAASRALAQHGDMSFRKLLGLSGKHSSAIGLADRWTEALRRFAPPGGMTIVASAGVSAHPA